MTLSKTIAGLIGPTLMAIAASLLLNLGTIPALVEQASHDPALIYVSGIFMFVAGLAIVRAHNRWTLGWTVLVTIFGWLALVGGLGRMVFSNQLGQLAAGAVKNTSVLPIAAVVLLALGAFLSFKAYRRD
jgi:hypothetical protein